MYVRVEVNTLKRFKGYRIIWAPVLIVSSRKNIKDHYVVDCIFNTYASDSRLYQILLTFKVRESIKIDVEPCFKLPEIGFFKIPCRIEDFKVSINHIKALFTETKKISLNEIRPERLVLSHILSPTRRILGDFKQIKNDVMQLINVSLVKDIINEIETNIDFNNVLEAKILYTIGLEQANAYALIGRSIIHNKVLSHLITKNIELQKLLFSIEPASNIFS